MASAEKQSTNRKSAPPADLSPDELLSLLDGQLRAYRRLQEITRRQRSLVSEENPSALLSLLAERQQLVCELTELDAKVAPVRREWDRISRTLPSAPRHRASEIFREARSILEDIIASDRTDTELLKARQANVQEAIRTIDRSRQAHDAYASARADASKYLDERDQES